MFGAVHGRMDGRLACTVCMEDVRADEEAAAANIRPDMLTH
jgi:hypothetical protein